MFRPFALALVTLAVNVAAHGYIKTFTLDGVTHEGYDRYDDDRDPNHIGWNFTTPDEGPVLDITSPDFVCRQGAEPATYYGRIAAGGTVSFLWTSDDKELNPDGWSQGHRGPIITYIASCGGDCTTVDKTALRWTKIAEEGLISGTANVDGFWATDKLRENGGINYATIPSDISSGKYVIRNEIIALHRFDLGQPESYAQCGNIEVIGHGSNDVSSTGVVAAELYSHSDNIFNMDIRSASGPTTWKIPGPPLYHGVPSSTTRVPMVSGTPGPQDGNHTTSSTPTPAPAPTDGESYKLRVRRKVKSRAKPRFPLV